MGLTAMIPQPGTSKRHRAHPVHPYLLRHLTISRPIQVWAMDITYIPMARGFVYLAGVMDWASRKVLAWRVSISLESAFCLAAVEEAIARYGCPEIFNTDQGAQFTSAAFTGLLTQQGIRISMDGRGFWRDNIFVERLWRSLKYEEVYLLAYEWSRRPPPASGATSPSTTPVGRTRVSPTARPTRPTSLTRSSSRSRWLPNPLANPLISGSSSAQKSRATSQDWWLATIVRSTALT